MIIQLIYSANSDPLCPFVWLISTVIWFGAQVRCMDLSRRHPTNEREKTLNIRHLRGERICFKICLKNNTKLPLALKTGTFRIKRYTEINVRSGDIERSISSNSFTESFQIQFNRKSQFRSNFIPWSFSVCVCLCAYVSVCRCMCSSECTSEYGE